MGISIEGNMKKLLLIIVILFLPILVRASGMMMLGGGTPIADTGWSDNFDGGSGQLDNRTGWGSNKYCNDNSALPNDLDLGSNVLTRSENSGAYDYIYADYTPSSANYYVQFDAKVSNESIQILQAPVVRGQATPLFTGYTAEIRCDLNTITVQRFVSMVETDVLAGHAITALDWTAFHTVKVAVSGSGTSTNIKIWIDATLEVDVTDSVSHNAVMDNVGQGGICSWQSSTYTTTWDNFVIGY